MGRTLPISTTCLIGGIIIALLDTTVLGASVQRTDDLKNGSETVHLSATYTSIRYSSSEDGPSKTAEDSQQPSTAISATSDSTLLPSETNQVTEELNTSRSKKQSEAFPPEVSVDSLNKPLVISPIGILLKQEDASNEVATPKSNIQEKIQKVNVSSPSSPYALLSMDSGSTLIVPQLSLQSADDGATKNTGETDRVSENAASSEIEDTAKKPEDLSAQATALHSHFEPEGDIVMRQSQYTREGESQTIAGLENEGETVTNPTSNADKIELYAIPKEAKDIIALNSQLLGYSTGGQQSTADSYNPKHNTAELKDSEQDISTAIDTTEISTIPPLETTTRKRTFRRRRRRRKGQNSRARQTNDSYKGGEDIHVEITTNIPSGEAIEHEGVTDRPLSPARNRYGMRKVKYTVRSTTENYRRETLVTSESANDGPNSGVEKVSGRTRSPTYRKRRPRYRVSVRRRNNYTLINDENDTWESGQSNNSSVILNPTESTQKSIYEETTESSPSQQETEYFPVTTLRTHIIQAINELQQINTLIASRKDEISNYTKNEALPQPLILQSRPLTQNSLEANVSQNERSFLRNVNFPEQEMAKLLHSLLNRTHARTPINAPQDIYQQNFGETTQNLQRLRNFTQKYKDDFSSAASTIDKNVNSIQQVNHQPKFYIRNDTQGGTFSSVYLLDGIPVKELVERDLVTSEQQIQYHKRPTNAVSNICQNNTIPEIIDCIRNIEQRKSPGRKEYHNQARNSAIRDFTKVTQAEDLKAQRSSRNSTVLDIPAFVDQRNKGSPRNNRDFLSVQPYSKPTEQGISVKSTTQYSTNLSPNRNRKTVSTTPKLGITYAQIAAHGKPSASSSISGSNNNANSITTSLSGALKVGGRMLLSHLQRLRNVILQIPGHIGRLSAEVGDQKQKQKPKPSSPVTSLFAPRSSASFIWR